MKIIKKILLALLALLFLLFLFSYIYFEFADCGISPYGCGDFSMTENFETTKISVGSGPEDMAIDTSQGFDRIIVSCTERRENDHPDYGGFYGINPQTEETFEFTIVPSDLVIHPHGIDIINMDSTHWLYAITHDILDGKMTHRVMRFEIQKDTLWLDQNHILQNPKMMAPNDLHVLADGSFYATNYLDTISSYSQTITVLGAKTGTIVYFDGKDKWELINEAYCYPNGIWVDKEEAALVLANGGCKEILKYKIIGKGNLDLENVVSSKTYLEIPIADNFIEDIQGRLWTVNHPCPLKFTGHAKSSENHSPIQVYSLDQKTLEPHLVYQNNGETISAASTALNLNGNLYISQVFDPFVLVIKNLKK